MAITLDATSGGALSNSYLTLPDANTYFESRANSSIWTAITDDEIKKQLLITATKTIDYNDFLGTREDTTTPQALKFPRIGLPLQDGISYDSVIPKDIKEATCELAIHLASVDMSTFGTQSGAIKKEKVGSLEVTYAVADSNYVPNNKDLPPFVTDLLSNYSNSVSDGAFIFISR